MQVKWLGHSAFLITSEAGVKIITDPYDASRVASNGLKYGEIKGPADIVTVSHEHGDHNNVRPIGGNPKVVKSSTEVKGIKFMGIPTSHDESGGSKRGSNTIFCFEMDGIKVCHLGDLGHQLTDKQVAEVGQVDVLLIPVGGYFTIDARGATAICDRLKPKVVIPMHFKTDKVSYPIATAEDFLKGKKNVKRLDASETELKKGQLPAETQIILLKPAL